MSAVAKKRKTQRTEPGNSPLILIVLGVGLLIIGWMAVSASMNTATGRVGSAPDFTATTLTGETVRLSDYRGQIVMLNFWATWCPPCRAEMPELEAVWRQYKDTGLVLLGVDQAESANVVAQFARGALGVTFPILLDTNLAVRDQYAVRALPTTVFIDAAGRIQDVKVGGPLDKAAIIDGVNKIVTR